MFNGVFVGWPLSWVLFEVGGQVGGVRQLPTLWRVCVDLVVFHLAREVVNYYPHRFKHDLINFSKN